MDWPDLETRITLADADRKATALLSLPRQLAEFVRASQLEPGRAEALLVALLLAGAVEPQPGVKAQPVAAPSAPPPAARQPAPPKPAAPPKATAPPKPTAPAKAAPKPAPPPAAPPRPAVAQDGDFDLQPAPPSRQKRMEEREAIERLDALSLDDVPPVPQKQEEEALELDRPAAAKPSPGAEDDRAREMRKKMLARGLRNLGGLTREERENSVAVTPKYPAPAPRGAAAPREGEMSAEEQRYADDVRSRLRLAPGQNAYARLGVDATSSSEKIRNAYLEAAKLFHPDRAAGPALSALQPELQTLFALLKEAYEEIATPDARKKYEAALKHRSPEGVRKEEAGIALKMGEVLLKKRDFAEALIKLRRSVELDPTGDALAALAWGLVADPKSSAALKEEAAGLINKALRAPGVTARTYYVAGVLWRTKDPESAVDAFRKALEMDPKHQDAALEIRLIEQRRNKPPARKSGGVLSGLLFGKRKS
jgi:tetratricopeptide (TPR) repeat protein